MQCRAFDSVIMPRRIRSTLPYPSISKTVGRLPRKKKRAIYRQIAISVCVITLLVVLIRFHHYYQQDNVKSRHIIPRNKPSELKSIPRNLYYMRSEKVLYCYIPKNACSRFKPLLRKREGFSDWNDSKMIHGKKNGLQRLMWLPYDEALSILQDESYKKFVIIRDPFSRLISAYQNKIATPWPDQREDFWEKHLSEECPEMVSKLHMPNEGALMSLETFLKCLLSKDKKGESNEHWRPQTELCGLDHIQYNWYLQLEHLVDDVKGLLKYLNWKENAEMFRIIKNPVYSRDLNDYFSSESLKLALQYYQQDFQVLRYSQIPTGKIDFYSVFDGTNFQPGFIPPVNFNPHVENATTQ